MKNLFFLLIVICLSSCAGVKIHNGTVASEKMKKSMKVHLPKPFLLVERNPAKDVKVKTSIIYLPDLSDPYYIQPKNGMGTSNITFNLEKGYMSSFGAITDSKTPETITAIAGAATGSITALDGLLNGASEATGGDEGGEDDVYKNLKNRLTDFKSGISSLNTDQLSPGQKTNRTELLKDIDECIKLAKEEKPSKDEQLKTLLKKSVTNCAALVFENAASDAKKEHNDDYGQRLRELKNAVAKFKPKKETSSIELYEILFSETGGYHLKRVSL